MINFQPTWCGKTLAALKLSWVAAMRLKWVSGIVPEEMASLLWMGLGFDVDVYAKYSCTWINDYSVSILGYKIIENYLRLPLPKAPPLTVKPKSSRTVAPRFFNFSRVLFKRCEQNWWLRLLQYSDLKASWSLEIFESPKSVLSENVRFQWKATFQKVSMSSYDSCATLIVRCF